MDSSLPKPRYALETITLKMTSSLELGEVLEAVTTGLVEEMGAASAQLWLPEGQEARLESFAGVAPAPQAPPRIRQLVDAEPGDHFCTNSLPTDGSVGSPGWLLENGLRSLAALPLEFRDSCLGVLATYWGRHLETEEFERLYLFAREAAVAIQNARLFEEVAHLRDRLEQENSYLQEQIEQEHGCGGIIGSSGALREVLMKVDQVASTDATVLIQGETGTGKELVALEIHKRSRRSGRPLVKVNCGAISSGLAESELFGHEKGAFTGALERRIGRFELANGGTLFLDEIAELPLETQVKLLRVLQEGEVERLGSSQPRKVNVRIIAAGNRNLQEEVAAGRFREDLFYRLNVFPIQVPPLRDRMEDVPLIATCALGWIGERIGKKLEGISDRAYSQLQQHSWPGNVRELLNFLERAAILSPGRVLDFQEGPGPSGGPTPDRGDRQSASQGSRPQEASPLRTLEEVEKAHIQQVLDHTNGIISGPRGAAKILGLHPNTLRSRMERLHLLGGARS